MIAKTVIGYVFNDHALLERALTHKSTGLKCHNDYLEWIGDNVLSYIITQYIHDHYSYNKVGEAHNHRTKLICNQTLSSIGTSLKLHVAINYHSNGNSTISMKIIADTVEALIGAIYLDSDLRTTTEWVHKVFKPWFNFFSTKDNIKQSPINLLQEYTQKNCNCLPEYLICQDELQFLCILTLPKRKFYGQGLSKRKAKHQAATHAINSLLID